MKQLLDMVAEQAARSLTYDLLRQGYTVGDVRYGHGGIAYAVICGAMILLGEQDEDTEPTWQRVGTAIDSMIDLWIAQGRPTGEAASEPGACLDWALVVNEPIRGVGPYLHAARAAVTRPPASAAEGIRCRDCGAQVPAGSVQRDVTIGGVQMGVPICDDPECAPPTLDTVHDQYQVQPWMILESNGRQIQEILTTRSWTPDLASCVGNARDVWEYLVNLPAWNGENPVEVAQLAAAALNAVAPGVVVRRGDA